MKLLFKTIAAFFVGFIKGKISNKLIAVSSSFFVISVTLVCVGNYYFTSHELRKAYFQNNKKVLDVISENFENYMDQISRQSLAIRNDDNLITSMASGDYSYEIENKLRLLSLSRMAALGINKIEFYAPKSGKVFLIEGYSAKTYSQDYTSENWYRKTAESRDFKYIEPMREYAKLPSAFESKGFIIFRRIIIDIEDKKPLVFINMYIDMSIVNKYLTLAKVKEGETLFIFDNQGTVYYANDLSDGRVIVDEDMLARLGNKNREMNDTIVEFNKVKYIKVSGESASGWRIVKIVPLKLIDAEIKDIFTFAIIAILVLILVATIAIIIIVKSMTSGISRLAKYMDYFAAGNFHVQIRGASTDEIGRLTERFNFMARKVNELINEEYKLKLSEKNAILKALEAQVNPHFLYNTLQEYPSSDLRKGTP